MTNRDMWMNVIDSLFSFVCCGNEVRSFVINGHVLPFCQRCTGVYVGLGVTFVYLLVTVAYRRGLVRGPILAGIAACVGVMVIFGCHWVDPGPGWRFWSGLVFGNAVAWLLLPAAGVLWRGSAVAGRGHSVIGYFAGLGVLSVMPLWFPFDLPGVHGLVVGLALFGIGGVVVCAVAAVWAVARVMVKFLLKGAAHGYSGT